MKLLTQHRVSFIATRLMNLFSHNHRVPFTATLKTSRHMVGNGVPLNVNTHNVMIHGFAAAAEDLQSDLEYTFELSEKEMKEALAVRKAMTEKGLSPDAGTYKSLIIGLCLQRRLPEAFEFFQEMLRGGVSPDRYIYACLMDSFCLEGEFSKAFHMRNEMVNKGFLPDFVTEFSPSLVTYNALIQGHCFLGRVEEAVGILRGMPVSPDDVSYSAIISGFCRIKEFRKAFEMKMELDDNGNVTGPDAVTYLLLMQGLSDEDTYTSLMNAYLDEGELDKVGRFHYEMDHFGFLPYSVMCSVIFNGLKSRPRETRKYLLRWVSHSCYPTLSYLTHDTLIENCSQNEFESLVGIVQGFCRRGLGGNAYDTRLQWNSKPDGAVYNLLILEHCKCGNVEEGYNAYLEMVHYGFASHMYSVLALIEALSWIQRFNELNWVIQNVLRSCNLNDPELLRVLNKTDVRRGETRDALMNVLAEKAADGLLLNGGKCSYAPASA